MWGAFPNGIEYNVGPGFGLTRGSDHVIMKFNVEWQHFVGAILGQSSDSGWFQQARRRAQIPRSMAACNQRERSRFTIFSARRRDSLGHAAFLQNMHDANGADAHQVSKSCLCVGLLPDARFAAQLARDLAICPAPVGPIGWPIPRAVLLTRLPRAAAYIEVACRDGGGGLAGRAQPHRLHIQQLFDRERIVEFQQTEVAGSTAASR